MVVRTSEKAKNAVTLSPALTLPGVIVTFAKIRLYCPKCLDEVKLSAASLTPETPVACGTCNATLKAGELSTSKGQSFTRYAMERARIDITFSGASPWR